MENTNFDTSIFGTSRSFKEWLHDTTNPLVYCLLTLDGKEFLAKNSYSVNLHQKTAHHDSFSITVPDDALDRFEGYVMENSKNLLGKDLTITYWRFGKIRQTFTGIIGKIRNKKDEGGGYGDLHITGFAPSILLESGKDCQSFEEKTLEQIIKEVTVNYSDRTYQIDISWDPVLMLKNLNDKDYIKGILYAGLVQNPDHDRFGHANTKIEGYVWDWFEDLEKINLSYSHTETKRQIITDRIEPETTVIIKSKIYKSSGEKYNTQFLRILKNGQKYYHHSTDEYTLY